MSYFGSTEWYQRAAAGEVSNVRTVHKFGKADVGTTMAPITNSGEYKTPSAAVALEVLSDSADDAAGGTGARSVTIEGLDGSFAKIEQTVALNGTTPVAIPTSMTRVYRWYVQDCGTYGSTTQGAHVGELTIREAGGGDVWTSLPNSDIIAGQSLIGCFSFEAGATCFGLSLIMGVDAAKETDLIVFLRERADESVAPFGPRRILFYQEGVKEQLSILLRAPIGPMNGPADLFVMSRVDVGTAEVSLMMELLVVGP